MASATLYPPLHHHHFSQMGVFPLFLGDKTIFQKFLKIVLKSFNGIFLSTSCTTEARKYVLQLCFYHHVDNSRLFAMYLC